MFGRPRSPRASRAGGKQLAALLVTALGLTAAPAVFGSQSARAEGTTIVFDSLEFRGEDSNPGDGTCSTGGETPVCTLRAAIQEANATAGTDPITITPAAELTGAIQAKGNGADDEMYDFGAADRPSIADDNGLEWGAWYWVQRPMTIDFANRVSVELDADDSASSAFFIDAPGVTITNFPNVNSSESSFVISPDGKGTTISNGTCKEVTGFPYWERCIVINGGAHDVTISNLTVASPWDGGSGIMLTTNDQKLNDGTDNPDKALVRNLTIDGAKFLNDSEDPDPYIPIRVLRNGMTLEGLKITNSTFDGIRHNHALYFRNGTLNGGTISGNKFVNMPSMDRGIDVFDTKVTNLTIDGNEVADSTLPGPFFDIGASGSNENVAITNNVFKNLTLGDALLDFRHGVKNENIRIAGNQFLDLKGAIAPTIWVATPEAKGNVVEKNIFKTPAGFHAWVFVYEGGNNGVTGWVFQDNHIEGWYGAQAPVRVDSGQLPVQRNTFSAPSRGTTAADDEAAKSETEGSWFVWNVAASSNNKIRTWHTTSASFREDLGQVTVSVAPPGEKDAGTKPKLPVAIDVYYSPGTTNKDGVLEVHADKYLGRVEGVQAAGALTLPCDGCSATGYIRVQTIDADGNTSQYSRIVRSQTAAVPSTPAPEPPKITAPQGEVGPGNPLKGTGTPSYTVRVLTVGTSTVVCHAQVASNGNWSCTPQGLAPGTYQVVATQTDPNGNVSSQSEPIEIRVAAVTDTTTGGGVGGAGATDPQALATLPETGSNANRTTHWGLLLLAAGLVLSLLGRRLPVRNR